MDENWPTTPLEDLRILAVARMSEGEHPAAVAACLGLNRSWAYKCRALAKASGQGLKASHYTQIPASLKVLA
jgi:hypothetical protein